MRTLALLLLQLLVLGCGSYLQDNFFVEIRDARRRDCPPRATADMKPVPVWRVPPRYPDEAWEQYVQGRVLVEFELDAAGHVSDPRIIAEEPEGYFGEVSLAAVREWEYCPIKAGEPSYARPHRVVIPFRLGPPPDEIPLAPGDLDLEPAR